MTILPIGWIALEVVEETAWLMEETVDEGIDGTFSGEVEPWAVMFVSFDVNLLSSR